MNILEVTQLVHFPSQRPIPTPHYIVHDPLKFGKWAAPSLFA